MTLFWIKNMSLNRMRLSFGDRSDPAKIEEIEAVVEGHVPFAEPYGSMDREELAELLNEAYKAGDPVAYAVVEEHLLDKSSEEELCVHCVAHSASGLIGEALGVQGFPRMERVMAVVFDLVIGLKDELNPAGYEPRPTS